MSKDDIISNINRKPPVGLDKNGTPYQILVVDDSTIMRKMIIRILKSEAFSICGEASDGEQAIDLYKELKPHIVTMDVNMPKMDGIEALKGIISYDPNAVVVMLTSEGQKDVVLNAISLGAKNYIVKPPSRDKVITKITQAINK